MSGLADAPFVSRPESNYLAGALALGVHVVFVLLLVFGVSWQTQHPSPVMVDVWESLPAVTPPAVVRPPRPQPPPPEPARPAPPPEPVAKTPPSTSTPDIALEKMKAEAERKKREAMQAAEAKARADAAQAAREKQLADQKKHALLRQMEEEDLTRKMAEEEAAIQSRLASQAEVRAAASRRQAEVASIVGQHRDLISAKVRGNTRLPANLTGNPEVRCLVKLMPTGEVQSVRVTQSSGNPAYDEAVVRAIEKSSPLPLPADRDARAAFVPELSFVHRPK